ncbi:YfjI family protein [Psychrobacter arenosus]|uniref:YfjI family protein n=1 Tax=Psychrobacter arenosus TaxID=256326 RepID=UPI00191A3403|nr:YfjI family protein [Psychrobacter arenosus]
MTSDKNDKAHAQGTGLVSKLTDFRPATRQALGNDEILEKLYDLEHVLDHSLGLSHKLLHLHEDISIGGDFLPTANTIGLVTTGSDNEPITIGSIRPNDSQTPLIADASHPSAFVIGDLSPDGDKWATTYLAEGVNLYAELNAGNGRRDTVLVSLNHWQYERMVKHFSKAERVRINTTADKKSQLIKTFKGYDIDLVVTTVPLDRLADYDEALDNLLADAEIINLKQLGWPTPQDINKSLPQVKTFTKDMMPDLLWAYAANSAERLSVPIEYVLIPLVVGLGAVIGTKLTIYPKKYDNWEISPNFFGAIVGNPSSKKSPSLTDGLRPIAHLVALAQDKYNIDKLEHEAQKELNKHMAKATEKQLSDLAKKLASKTDEDDSNLNQDTLKAKAQELAQAKQNDELIPEKKRYITDDGTIESLGELESKHKNGILAKRDELTGLLASLDNENNLQARSFYLEGFNGLGSFQVDRIGRGSIYIDTHCLSVIGGIQPDKLEFYLAKTVKGLGNDGLIQRFQLIVYPDPLPNNKEKDLPPDKESRDAIYNLFETIDNMQLGDFMKYGANPIDEYHKRPYYRFSDEAYPIFMSWYDDLKAKANDTEHGIIAEHLIKYAKTVPSLALIFHLVDCIEHGGNLGPVSSTALKAALAWCDVLQTHMMRVYSAVTDSANIKASYLSEKILKMVKQGADKTDKTDWLEHGFTARQLIRKGWKGLTDADDVLNALEVLIENDWLSWKTVESTGQGGRPTERYNINPRLIELT